MLKLKTYIIKIMHCHPAKAIKHKHIIYFKVPDRMKINHLNEHDHQ